MVFEFLPIDKTCDMPHAGESWAISERVDESQVDGSGARAAWAKEMALKFDAEMERGGRCSDGNRRGSMGIMIGELSSLFYSNWEDIRWV